jgi:hypothetical protein
LSKKRQLFRQIFWRKYIKNPNIGPGSPDFRVVALLRQQVGERPASQEPHDGRADFRTEEAAESGFDGALLDLGDPEDGRDQLDDRIARFVT